MNGEGIEVRLAIFIAKCKARREVYRTNTVSQKHLLDKLCDRKAGKDIFSLAKHRKCRSNNVDGEQHV